MAGAPPGQTLTVRVVTVAEPSPQRNTPDSFRDRLRAQAATGVAASQAAALAAQQAQVVSRPKANFIANKIAPTASPAERIAPASLGPKFASIEGASNKARDFVTGGAVGALLGKVFAPLVAFGAVSAIVDQITDSTEFKAAKAIGNREQRNEARAFGFLDATIGTVAGGFARTVGFDEVDVQSARRWFKETFTPGLIELEAMQAATTARKQAFEASYAAIVQATAAEVATWRVPVSVYLNSRDDIQRRARDIAERNAFNAGQRAKEAVRRGEAIANAPPR